MLSVNMIPTVARPGAAVFVVALAIFVLSGLTRVPTRSPLSSPDTAQSMRASVGVATRSLQAAAQEKDAVNQLIHVSYGRATLATARRLARNDDLLSDVCEIDVLELDRRLAQADAAIRATIIDARKPNK